MKSLGLDLGTNSIGWALVETNGSSIKLLHKGVHIFEKGVGEGKSGEYSLAAERTRYRASRRLKMRRKWRKQATLRILIEHDYCPGIKQVDLDLWRDEKLFPTSPEFRAWLHTKEFTADGRPAGPYYYRWLAATEKLDLTSATARYQLGRAFYHLSQRRGYKSNRVAGEERDGTVNTTIEELDKKRGDRTLGQYYYEECLGKEPVRGGAHYTSRKQYEEEFKVICARQSLPKPLSDALEKAIFTQRPLRSQKGSVGTCPLEPTKARVPVSHPAYERFRALQTIANIRVAGPGESELIPLNAGQRDSALKWMLTLKDHKAFKDLAKRLTPKKAMIEYGGLREGRAPEAWVFNYREDADISPCPVNARLAKLFGDNWREEIVKRYAKSKGKAAVQIEDDVWHALFNFKDREKLESFGCNQLGLTEEESKVFAERIPQGYANLSLNAVRKIIPFMEKGLIYSHAVFMANLPVMLKEHVSDWRTEGVPLEEALGDIIGRHGLDTRCAQAVNAVLEQLKEDQKEPSAMRATAETWSRFRKRVEEALEINIGDTRWKSLPEEDRDRRVEQGMEDICRLYRADKHAETPTLDQRIKAVLEERYGLSKKLLMRLYHPSAIETYPPAIIDQQGRWKLGSPRIPSIKNPVFMRTMTRLRHLINALLKEGLIDPETRVRIEMARDLNTSNERAAIERENRTRTKENAAYKSAIEEAGFPATDTNILKYRLWEEQNRLCLYTGNKIGMAEFLAENPIYDLEHTLPRSRTLDNSQSNLTLCDRRFNREVKGNRIPRELEKADEIADRARLLWSEKIEELEALYSKRRNAGKRAATKADKDAAIADAHYYRNQIRYLRAKLRSFEVESIPEGFSNSQLVDTRIICKYAMLYLKSLFQKVYSVKAEVVHGVKGMWGLDAKYRGNHVHHCVDAIVTACLRPDFYQQLATFYRDVERHERVGAPSPSAPEPWDGFARYMNERLGEEVLCVHYTRNNLLKQTFKRMRERGKVKKAADGRPLMQRGNSARGSLHKDTVYGIIQEPPRKANATVAKVCVIRRKLDKSFSDFDDIVDERVKRLVNDQRDRIKNGETVWFDEKNGIPIKSARVRVREKPDSLIVLGAHAYASKHDYKQRQRAANDGNYMTALYRGTTNGKPKASWKVIQNIEAVQATLRGEWGEILPKQDDKMLSLRHVLKTGSLFLIYKKTPEELLDGTVLTLWKRLYRVTVMEGSRIRAVHHACALGAKELGDGSSKIEFDGAPLPKLYPSINGINILVAGQDFILDPLGRVQWLERSHA